MKKGILLILIIVALIHADGFSQTKVNENKAKPDTISVDSLEYRIIVLDPGFDSWLATQLPENYYSKSYYEIKNRIYVTEWNDRYRSGRNSNLYETYIEYDPDIDYGLDLNYKLYYFFKYFEKTNGIKLNSGDR